MNKTSHTPRGLKSQKHIDRVLYNLERYIAHYRVPQPQQLREATSQLIVGNLAPPQRLLPRQNEGNFYKLLCEDL